MYVVHCVSHNKRHAMGTPYLGFLERERLLGGLVLHEYHVTKTAILVAGGRAGKAGKEERGNKNRETSREHLCLVKLTGVSMSREEYYIHRSCAFCSITL